MRRQAAIALGALVLGLAGPAAAQICAGAASFSSGPLQVGAAIAFSDNARAFGGAFGGGTDAVFVLGSVGGVTIDNTDGTAVQLAVTVGSDQAVDREGRVRLCPVGSLTYLSGPSVGIFDTSTVGFSGGGEVGVVAAETPTVSVIPTFGVRVAHERLTVRLPRVDSETVSETFGLANIGVGFVFNDQIALVPSVSVPIGLEGGDTLFAIALAVNFGRR